MFGLEKKLTLYGFNNLTKSLSFNIYDVCYAASEREKNDYIEYIDEQYNSERLTNILCKVAEIIGANILNISKQDYEPQGASVNILISEGQLLSHEIHESRVMQNETLHAIWTKAMLPCIHFRSIILIMLFPPFGWTLMSPPVARYPL